MNTEQGRGAENGSMFLKQLDNLFGLGPLLKRHGNDGQLGQGEGRRGREMERKSSGGGVVQRRQGGGGGDGVGGKGGGWGLSLESQDLRVFWLDGSQMFQTPATPLPSSSVFLCCGEYTGIQL